MEGGVPSLQQPSSKRRRAPMNEVVQFLEGEIQLGSGKVVKNTDPRSEEIRKVQRLMSKKHSTNSTKSNSFGLRIRS
jgi:hypothetical protein